MPFSEARKSAIFFGAVWLADVRQIGVAGLFAYVWLHKRLTMLPLRSAPLVGTLDLARWFCWCSTLESQSVLLADFLVHQTEQRCCSTDLVRKAR